MILQELFEPGKQWQWSFTGSEEAVAVFHVAEIPYQFHAYTHPEDNGAWEVEFKNATRNRPMGRMAKFGLTGTGNSAEVMSTITDIMREFLSKYKSKVKALVFTADEPSRKSLYARMIKRLLPDWHLDFQDDKQFIVTAPKEISEYKTANTTEEFGGLDFRMVIDYPQLFVNALDPTWGKELGHVTFNIGDDKELDPQDLFVKDQYRSQGVARTMYDYVKSKGYKIQRSWDQTDAGSGFWDKHRGEDVRVWEEHRPDKTTELKKNRWALLVSDSDKNDWADNLIDLVANAYNSTSLGSFVQSVNQVQASDWVALDWDPQPDLDCTVFYRKARPNENWSGHKIQGIGHDGKAESKQRVIQRCKALLARTGVWIESSDAMARTLGKSGLDPVTDEQLLQQLFPDTNLRMIDNQGRYERDAGGTRIREQVFGNPVLKS